MRKIVTLTTDGNNREDCNVFYSRSVLVSTPDDKPGLRFNEPIFGNPSASDAQCGQFSGDFDGALEEIRRLGYVVDEIDEIIVLTNEG